MNGRSEVVKFAGIQCPLGGSVRENVARVSHWVEEAAKAGAQVVLPSELFEGPYFCSQEKEAFFAMAQPLAKHATVAHFQALAKHLQVALPVSLFEKDGPHYYNTVVMLDADGSILGTYRKSHIPDGPGYEEKFYFRPGNTGFRVWDTRYGKIGVGICWDQWYPECARAMALLGADVLLYPTAIGSEPHDASLDTRDPWQRAMIGHAVSNVVGVVAANRIGNEHGQEFYGSSFIANARGDKVAELGRQEEGLVLGDFDLAELRSHRAVWGFFRDRRPDLYDKLVER